jgi:DNA replication protein DnaC
VREPIEWKSPQWWRNRPLAERQTFVRLPKRIAAGDITYVEVDWEPGYNYLVHGPSKTGKSLFAAGMVDHVLKAHKVSARWVAADRYVEWIKDSFNNDWALCEEYSTPYLIKNVKAVHDIVVLDGLGEERQTDFAVHELGSLIRDRYDDMLTTIITTRLSPQDLIDRYGARISAALDTYELETPNGG